MNQPPTFQSLSDATQFDFSMQGRVQVHSNPDTHFKIWNRDTLAPHWDRAYVEQFIQDYTRFNIIRGRQGEEGYPGASKLHCLAFDKYLTVGAKVAVIGSQSPWIEAMLLNYGAGQVTTVEYNLPICDHPDISVISYDAFCRSSEVYDCIVTYSSVEHSGLGRYGDSIGVDDDLAAMTQIHAHLKDDGLCFFGAPMGRDAVVWNAHRIYGPCRRPLLFGRFTPVEWIGSAEAHTDSLKEREYKQPVIILKKS